MEYVITVYKKLVDGRIEPISVIRWTGRFYKNPKIFAKKHGGDFIEIQPLYEYLENSEQLDFI